MHQEAGSGPVYQEAGSGPVHQEAGSGPVNQEAGSGPVHQEAGSGPVYQATGAKHSGKILVPSTMSGPHSTVKGDLDSQPLSSLQFHQASVQINLKGKHASCRHVDVFPLQE